MDNKKINQGQIRAIRGSVVDAFFPQLLPKINHQLKSGEAIIEVTLNSINPYPGIKKGR
jgi:F-type H+-transporting ATPase subunit beta